jgi:hypothetical protein
MKAELKTVSKCTGTGSIECFSDGSWRMSVMVQTKDGKPLHVWKGWSTPSSEIVDNMKNELEVKGAI